MNVLAFFEFGDVSVARWQAVQRCWALFGLVLILATWRLWIPQEVYPQVPLVEVAGALPAVCQWAALVVAGSCLTVVLAMLPRLNDAAQACLFFAFVLAMAVLILTDQHRLQPWAYQFMIYAVVFGLLPSEHAQRRQGLALLRILILSIYLFSALGKFDYQFLHTVGQEFLGVALGFVGIDVGTWPGPLRLLLAALFPLVELLLVVTLATPRLRRIGVVVAILLHGSLLVVLGPGGLRHQPGVLIWNMFFITQGILLFFRTTARTESDSAAATAVAPTSYRWLPTVAVLTVVCLPLLEPIGWCDHWLAWGLYSPRNSRAIVEVHRAGLPSLPAVWKPYLVQADSEAAWVQLAIDDWSLDALSVPIYPQDRFQLGVAESIATRFGLERTIRVHLLGMSNRISGTRRAETLTGRLQIVAAANRYWFNAHPAADAGLNRNASRRLPVRRAD